MPPGTTGLIIKMVQLGLHFFHGCGIWVCGLNLQNESPWGTLKFESIGGNNY
jgi:hypothetical protein